MPLRQTGRKLPTAFGGTGTTLATAARALKGAVDRLPLADLTQLFRAIGEELSQTMGGSLGALLAIFFSAAGDASASGRTPINALRAGLERVQEVGGARAGADRTAEITRARAGRASYISPDMLAGHNDPGAEAIARLFERLAAG